MSQSPLVRTRGLWRGAPPLRTPCRPSRPFGAPGSGPARRRPPPPRRRPSRCCPCRAGRRRPCRRVSAAGNRPLVRLSTSPNRPSAAGTDGGRCGRTTPTTTILMKWSIVAPLVGASARARWRASEPSPQGYIRTGATSPTAGRGWYARGYTWRNTPHVAVPRQRQERGGRSRPLPLRWRGSGRPVQDEKPEQRQRKSDGWRGTPPTLFLVHPPSFARTILLDPRRDPHRDPGTVQRPTRASITWLPIVETGDRRTDASRRPFTAAVRPSARTPRRGTPTNRP